MQNFQIKQLFTIAQYQELLNNGSPENRGKDHKPVVKLFITGTNCTWLLTEIDPENDDIAFGLCDLGLGFPELGYVSLTEIVQATQGFKRFRFLERDKCFCPIEPVSVYAKAAYMYGQIRDDIEVIMLVAEQQ